MKKVFDKKVKVYNFLISDLVLKWDSRIENKGKHGNLIIYGNDHLKLQTIMGTMLTFYRV